VKVVVRASQEWNVFSFICGFLELRPGSIDVTDMDVIVKYTVLFLEDNDLIIKKVKFV